MFVLGIDPGTLRMGYGLVEEGDQVVAVDWGVISLKPSRPIEEEEKPLLVMMVPGLHTPVLQE